MAVNSSMQLINMNEIEIIRGLEESLWRSETRFNRDYMQQILAPDFIEFGMSGKVYSRAEILTVPKEEIHCTLPLKNFVVHSLGSDVIFVTYNSEVFFEAWQYTNRSSIWIKSPAGWQIRFHQGTPFSPM